MRRSGREVPGGVRAQPPGSGYWPKSWIVAGILMAVLAVRLAELLPVVPRLKPAVLSLTLLFPAPLTHSAARVREHAFKNPTVRLLLWYAAWGAFGVPFALYKKAAFDAVLLVPIGTIVVYALLLCPPTRAVMDRLAATLVLSVAALATLSHLGGQMVAGRLTTGGSFDPNDLAAVIAMTIPFALGMATRGVLKSRLLGLASLLVLVAVLLATGSRGGFIALAVGLLLFAFGMKISRATWLILLLAIAAPVAWRAAPPVFRERVMSMTDLGSDYNVTEDSGRKGTWTRGVGYALSHPMTGLGMGNFGTAEGERLKHLGRTGAWHTAHNTYIQVFAEMGFPGGLILLALLWRSFRIAGRMWRPRKLHRPEYLAGFGAFCAAAFFLSHAYAYHLFAILGIIAHAGEVHAAESVQRVGSQPATPRVTRLYRRGAATGSGGRGANLVLQPVSGPKPDQAHSASADSKTFRPGAPVLS